MLEPKPSYPNLEAFTIYREGRHDQTPRPCSEMYLYGIKVLPLCNPEPSCMRRPDIHSRDQQSATIGQ